MYVIFMSTCSGPNTGIQEETMSVDTTNTLSNIFLLTFKFQSCVFPPSSCRLHAHRRCGCSAEAPGCAPWGPAGLRGLPAPGGSPPGGQVAHDPPSAPPDLHQGCATFLQHQAGRQSPNAQTLPGAAGSQGLRTGEWTEGQPDTSLTHLSFNSNSHFEWPLALLHAHTLTHTHTLRNMSQKYVCWHITLWRNK